MSNEQTYTLNTFYEDLGGYVIQLNAEGTHGLVASRNGQGYATWDVAHERVNMSHDKWGGKFKDWRMPTKRELNLMYNNKNEIKRFENDTYWSSTELDKDSAWKQDFLDGDQNFMNKMVQYLLRVVRDF